MFCTQIPSKIQLMKYLVGRIMQPPLQIGSWNGRHQLCSIFAGLFDITDTFYCACSPPKHTRIGLSGFSPISHREFRSPSSWDQLFSVCAELCRYYFQLHLLPSSDREGRALFIRAWPPSQFWFWNNYAQFVLKLTNVIFICTCFPLENRGWLIRV